MLRAVPVPRIEADLHPERDHRPSSGRLAHVRRQVQIKLPSPTGIMLIRHGTEGLPLIRTRTGSGLCQPGLRDFALGQARLGRTD